METILELDIIVLSNKGEKLKAIGYHVSLLIRVFMINDIKVFVM